MREVCRDNRFPTPGPKMPILRLKGGEEKTLLVLSQEVQGFWVHWTGRSTVECTVPHDDCHGHKMGFASKWKGYLHVVDVHSKRQGFLELTPTLAEQLQVQLIPERQRSVRGVTLSVSRTKANNGRVKVLVTHQYPGTRELPEEVDPLPSLRVLWGYCNGYEKDN